MTAAPADDDGYRLWLRYELVTDAARRAEYRAAFTELVLGEAGGEALSAAQRELARGLCGLLGETVPANPKISGNAALLVGTPRSLPLLATLGLEASLARLGAEGFLIRALNVGGAACWVIASSTEVGCLYGAFHFLRQLQRARPLTELASESAPKLRYRMLDHWDNLDRTIERGYAGFSLWDWHKLPDYLDPRYEDYARACASLGINGSALTNVNANALILTDTYLRKVAALANVFRAYGVRVYLTARFSAPIEIGGLATADPLAPEVVEFWRAKAAEIYRLIPDFGGFLVKANSEGQPGPHDYQRTHAEGANVLADALAPHGGVVIWRAFVYSNEVGQDRHKQAYEELVPLDGQFRDNVLVQVKNGAIDFQPREPFHPLFGAMPKTPLLAEFQLTQEYLGCATHLCYLGPLLNETLDSDTFVAGPGSTVQRVLEGAVHGGAATGLAAVSNIGNERNWCGHPFAQANWFAYGRLAWDPGLRAADLATEWLELTFTREPRFVDEARAMMQASREAVVNYMTPLGLHHLMAWDHHYGPGPWIDQGRADWTSVYFHRADAAGIGFDRSASGSNAVAQYAAPLRERFGKLESCPESLWLWFHHVPWDQPLSTGRTLWHELCHRYDAGLATVTEMRATWAGLAGSVDGARHRHVSALLAIQEKEARWWRDACLLYFQTFARRPFPEGFDPPRGDLAEYRARRDRFVPGIRDSG